MKITKITKHNDGTVSIRLPRKGWVDGTVGADDIAAALYANAGVHEGLGQSCGGTDDGIHDMLAARLRDLAHRIGVVVEQ